MAPQLVSIEKGQNSRYLQKVQKNYPLTIQGMRGDKFDAFYEEVLYTGLAEFSQMHLSISQGMGRDKCEGSFKNFCCIFLSFGIRTASIALCPQKKVSGLPVPLAELKKTTRQKIAPKRSCKEGIKIKHPQNSLRILWVAFILRVFYYREIPVRWYYPSERIF